MMKKVMLIGFGAMAQAVIERLPPGVAIGWIVARESHHAAIRHSLVMQCAVEPLQCARRPIWC
jgi:aspartate dehydrogenase